ncbi:MAG: FAD:protein FMN transferase, partial [Bacteroidales bacterium]
MNKDYQFIYKKVCQGTLFYMWFKSMNTRIDIVFRDVSRAQALTVADTIYEKVFYLHGLMNRFDPRSELSRMNRSGLFTDTTPDKDLYNVIRIALAGHKMTNGVFDITTRPGRQSEQDIHGISLDSLTCSIRFLHKGIQIDLGGIAKGYGADRVADLLLKEQIPDFLINFGNSSIVAHGNQPLGIGWEITPNVNTEKRYCLKNEALSSSGNNNLNTAHIVDPRTGKYVTRTDVITLTAPDAASGEI